MVLCCFWLFGIVFFFFFFFIYSWLMDMWVCVWMCVWWRRNTISFPSKNNSNFEGWNCFDLLKVLFEFFSLLFSFCANQIEVCFLFYFICDGCLRHVIELSMRMDSAVRKQCTGKREGEARPKSEWKMKGETSTTDVQVLDDGSSMAGNWKCSNGCVSCHWSD